MRLRDNAGQRRERRVEIIIQGVCERRLLAEEALSTKIKRVDRSRNAIRLVG
jgi:hypothetical protein